MNIKDVTIAGAGLLGSQVAWQTAFSGFEASVSPIQGPRALSRMSVLIPAPMAEQPYSKHLNQKGKSSLLERRAQHGSRRVNPILYLAVLTSLEQQQFVFIPINRIQTLHNQPHFKR
ncbi:hypothetical protein BCT46_24930 [Vibrio sp. 10N.261.46.E8]|nr:hypothetical protein BH584_24485 [Vibrio sp. 10N.261.45.E1]PMJ33938.1 hypothetical protein BCU27_24920 [Vibrio sp. 10N.286.45.B6]PML93100.1 hypothetical protein BCT66_24880 [Vibrio sp. 10N.261.49.E11]PMM78535.1 hypothetical protein BCT48_22885 [Vibrio sp. 10N.261.46.F12]PMM89381.1 hypothetical protein BCT46_24930 [Vibrio sp. 10N.261.46.E8]PMN41923.1 hypothetical protein BCT34_22505 [Vibrio sp. 10N.261.45.E2]PMN50185.1 hypothetical protein BCT32_04785 [Vibrio sp. 10N.261.45.E11]PMN74821.1 